MPPPALVCCALPTTGSADATTLPPPPGFLLTCRFPCGSTCPGTWDPALSAVTCQPAAGVEVVVMSEGAPAARLPVALATVDVAPPPPPPPLLQPSACCGGRPCGPGTVITAAPASAPPAWMARACVDGLGKAGLAGKRVLVRADLNVPLRGGGRGGGGSGGGPAIADTSRLEAAVPTIRCLLDAGVAAVAVASHLGRPAGPDPALSLRPVAPALAAALGCGVAFVPASTGKAVEDAVRAAPPGSVLLLENVRFHGAAETGNDGSLAAALFPPALFDVFVNDAFGAAHRAHASTAGIAATASSSGRPAVAGLLLRAEMAALGRTLCCPRRPLLAIVGGAKLADKAAVVRQLVGHADVVCVGGALATTFLAALNPGACVGEGAEGGPAAAAAVAAAAAAAKAGTRLVLPVDVVAAPRTADGTGWDAARAVTVPATAVPGGFTALDAGPETVAQVALLAATAWTVAWNGPLGLAEEPAFSAGTAGVAAALAPLAAAKGVTTIVGGGHSVAAVRAAGFAGGGKGGTASFFSHISTGGGATLELLEGQVLPGVDALDEGPGLEGVCN